MDWKTRLKEVREAHPLYKKKVRFAEAVGVSPATATDWEKSFIDGGIKTINGPHLSKVCELLKIRSHWLLYGLLPKGANDPLDGDQVAAIEAVSQNEEVMIEVARLHEIDRQEAQPFISDELKDSMRLLDLYSQASDEARKQLLRVAELSEKRNAQSGTVGVNKSQ